MVCLEHLYQGDVVYRSELELLKIDFHYRLPRLI
jgi:hypothetical protein